MRRAFLSPRRAAAGGVATAALAAALAFAPSAGAIAATVPHPTVVHLDGKTYSLVLGPRMGIKPIHSTVKAPPASSKVTVHSSASTGVVTPTPQVYLVFWGSQWSTDPDGAEPALQAFFKGLFGSHDTWGTIIDQYCEGVPKGTANCGSSGTHIQHPTSTPLAGVFLDNSAKEPSHATAAQLGAEAVKAAHHFGATATTDLNADYVIASPHGTHPDGFPNSGFCAYHSDVSSSGLGKVAFTNLPYVPDLGKGQCTTLKNATALDGYFSTETHEYAETATDVYPSAGWLSGGSEIGDLCVQLDSTETLTTGTYDVQGIWSNLDGKCVTAGP